jgi:hypothetical protein
MANWVSRIISVLALYADHSLGTSAAFIIHPASSRESTPNPGRSNFKIKTSGGDLGRLDVQDFAEARDRDSARLHSLRNLAHKVDV